jgi:transposase
MSKELPEREGAIRKPILLTPKKRRVLDQRRWHTQDRRICQRLTAVLAVAAGKTRAAVADLLGSQLTQWGDWLRVFRNPGGDALGTLPHQGAPGKLTPAQVKQLQDEIRTGRFRNSAQVRHWLEDAYEVAYSSGGVRDLLKRLGAS